MARYGPVCSLLVIAIITSNLPDVYTAGGSDSTSQEKPAINYHSDIHKLFSDIFSDYTKDIPPVHSHYEIIKIKFEIALFNVLQLDSKTGLMTTNSELIVSWMDPFLKWDPSLYNDTHEMRVPHYNIWEPDIILYNSAAKDYQGSIISTNAIVQHTGEVKLLLQAIFVSTCDVDIQWYPFDQQTCDLMFGSRTFDLQQVVLEQGQADVSRYHPNHEFVLENFYSDLIDIMDPCCDHPFALISYHVQLQRRVKFAVFFFIVPGVLINICAVMVFSLPAETGEKVGLGINAMLAMMVFLMAMIENLPPSENIPLAGLYYGVCLAVITANIALSVYVMNLNFGGNRGLRLPQYLRYITKTMAGVLRCSVPPVVEEMWRKQEEVDSLSLLRTGDKGPTVTQVHPMGSVVGEELFGDELHFSDDIKDPFQRGAIRALHDIVRMLTLTTKTRKMEQKENTALVEEWKMASRVLDRLFFILFGLTTFLFNVILLTQSPFSTHLEFCVGEEGCAVGGGSGGHGGGH